MNKIPDTFRLLNDGKAIECLMCGGISYHVLDIQNLWCSFCHEFHDDIWPPTREWCITEGKKGSGDVARLAEIIYATVRGEMDSMDLDPNAEKATFALSETLRVRWRGNWIRVKDVWPDVTVPLSLNKLRASMIHAAGLYKYPCSGCRGAVTAHEHWQPTPQTVEHFVCGVCGLVTWPDSADAAKFHWHGTDAKALPIKKPPIPPISDEPI